MRKNVIKGMFNINESSTKAMTNLEPDIKMISPHPDALPDFTSMQQSEPISSSE